MIGKISQLGNRYGWGVLVSAAPFVNAIAVITASLACYLLIVVFQLFGIDPCPPSQGGNLFGWMLWVLIMACVGWFYWSMFLFYFLVPLGLAWSLADLIQARTLGNRDKAVGASAGLALTLIPLSIYFRAIGHPGQELADIGHKMAHPGFVFSIDD